MAQVGRIYDSYQENTYETYQPTDRFYVRSSVYLPGGDIDPRTGKIRDDLHRRGRTQALRMEADKLDQEYAMMDAALASREKETGKRISLQTAVVSIVVLFLLFFVTLLVQQGTLAHKQRSLKNVNQQIETIRADNQVLRAQITDASDATTICYAAARDLGMVPAAAAQAIHLAAMDTRPAAPVEHVSASVSGQTVADATVNTGE